MRTLYKFVGSRSAVEAIDSGSLKFPRIGELNDPSELVPLMSREANEEYDAVVASGEQVTSAILSHAVASQR